MTKPRSFLIFLSKVILQPLIYLRTITRIQKQVFIPDMF